MNTNFRHSSRNRPDWRSQALDVAVHASSLWDGLIFQRDSDEIFRIWDQGGIELHFRMADIAMTDAQLCEALYEASDSNFPGVYTYEVTEALGQMIAAHLVSTGEFPTEAEWQTALGELALTFFEQGNFSSPEMDNLRQVVAQVLPRWSAIPPGSPPQDLFPYPPTKPPPLGGHSQATA